MVGENTIISYIKIELVSLVICTDYGADRWASDLLGFNYQSPEALPAIRLTVRSAFVGTLWKNMVGVVGFLQTFAYSRLAEVILHIRYESSFRQHSSCFLFGVKERVSIHAVHCSSSRRPCVWMIGQRFISRRVKLNYFSELSCKARSDPRSWNEKLKKRFVEGVASVSQCGGWGKPFGCVFSYYSKHVSFLSRSTFSIYSMFSRKTCYCWPLCAGLLMFCLVVLSLI